MYREILDDIYLVQECNVNIFGDLSWTEGGGEIHNPINAFLIDDEQSLLFDTLSPQSTGRILDSLDEILDGGDLDYLVPSHPEAPHAGNVLKLQERYPDCTVFAPDFRAVHDLYYLEGATQVATGDSLDLGDHVVEFFEPTFPDVSLTFWLFERRTRTIFTVDWAGNPHLDDECLAFVDEIPDDLSPRIRNYHGNVLPWFRYADPEKTNSAIERLIEEYRPEVLAPAHGSVAREDAAEYMRKVGRVVNEIAIDDGEVVAEIEATLPGD